MSGYNGVIVLGRLTGLPEQLTTKNGKLFIKATIATSVYRQTADGKSEERTSFIPVTIFGRQAEVFLTHVHKGDIVHLVGRLDSNEWKTDSGEKRISLSFVVEQLNLLPNERVKVQQKPQPKRPEATPGESPPAERRSRQSLNELGEPNEIPF